MLRGRCFRRRQPNIPHGTHGNLETALNVRYYIDNETGQPHLYRHDVGEREVEQGTSPIGGLARPGEDRPGREGSRVAIGRTLTGRYLRVIYVPDAKPESVFVITAYELKGKPLTAYKRRMRRRR